MTRKWYATLRHPKMYPHTKFGIPTSMNIGDMDRTRKRDGRTDGRTDSAITICLPKILWGHKKQVLSALFGGIPNAGDSVIIGHQIDQARQVINRVASTFIPYFEKRVLPLLLDYVAYLSPIKSIDANRNKT